MKKTNGAQTVEVIEGRRIVYSAGVGTTTVDEIRWLSDTIVAEAAQWKETGWAYIADTSQMNPVAPSVGKELVIMTQRLVEAGCKAIGFAEGEAVMLKIQAKRNTELSNTGVMEGHFSTLNEVLKWLDVEIHI